MPYVHPFLSYVAPRDATRDLRIFQLREGAAALEAVAALHEHGFELGDTLLNTPSSPLAEPEERLYPIDLSNVDSEDAILTLTRLPVGDMDWGEKKQVHRAWTDLERKLLDTWKEIFDDLTRTYVSLAPRTRHHLREGFENRQAVRFLTREGAPYSGWNARDGRGFRKQQHPHRTAAFLLRRDELWPGGPGYVGMFGMDGNMSLIWAHLLRRRYSYLLEKPAFTMVEISGEPFPERPTRLDFARDWHVEIVVHAPL